MDLQLNARTTMAMMMYATAMKGVMRDAALAILLIPPTTTRPIRKARNSPDTKGLIPKEFIAAVAIPLAWTVGRSKPVATMVIMAKAMASHLDYKPFSM